MITSTLLRIQLGQKDLDWICTSDCKLATWRQLSFSALQSSPHDNIGVFQVPAFQVKATLAVIALEYPQYITCTGSILKSQNWIQISHPYFTESDIGCMEEGLTHGEILTFIPSVKKPGQSLTQVNLYMRKFW